MDRTELRAIFDEDADAYDRARPGYPAELFADLASAARLGLGSRVVEIGPGTGQATPPFVALGAHVTAVELGSALAARLRANFRDHAGKDRLHVVEGAFEDWVPDEGSFDAVVAFTAWHWLDRDIRIAKVHDLLRPGGTLATVSTSHVAGGTEAFFAEVQACYERFDPNTPPGLRLEAADHIPADTDEADDSANFEPAERRRYTQDIPYSTDAYVELLRTYSGHRALPAGQREGLLRCIRELIERRYGGGITKRHLYELRTTTARSSNHD